MISVHDTICIAILQNGQIKTLEKRTQFKLGKKVILEIQHMIEPTVTLFFPQL